MSEGDVPQGTGAAQPPTLRPSQQVQSQEADVPKPKPQRVMPDRPVPTLGWPAVWYKLMCLFGQNHRVPQLNKQEHRQLSRAQAIAGLRELTDTVPMLSFAFWNTKGGAGKTPTAVYTSEVLSEYSRTLTVLVDGNQAAGTCAARYGLDYKDTVTTHQLARDIREGEELAHRDFRSQITKARPSTKGVRVVSAESIVDDQRQLSGKGMARVLELMTHNCEYLSVDTGNNLIEPLGRSIANASDVFVFVANANNSTIANDTLRKLATSMETLRQLGFEDKVNHSVVVVVNMPKGATADDYRIYLNEVDLQETPHVTRKVEHKFDGQFVGVHHDSYIARDGLVDLDKLSWDTLQDYIMLMCAILRQAPKLRSLSSYQHEDTYPTYGTAVHRED